MRKGGGGEWRERVEEVRLRGKGTDRWVRERILTPKQSCMSYKFHKYLKKSAV